MDDDTPVWHLNRWHWAAIALGGILWIAIWYCAGSLLWFVFTLR